MERVRRERAAGSSVSLSPGLTWRSATRHRETRRFRRSLGGRTMALVEQQLGTAIRFAVAGRGPVAIHVPGWVSHLELGWAVPAERQFYEGLADGRTLVRYDRPGCGLSGPTDRADLVELELEVLQLVASEVGAEH